MKKFRVTINERAGIYKRIDLTPDQLVPIKFNQIKINDADTDIFLVNMDYDTTLMIGRDEVSLIKRWLRNPPDIEEINTNQEFIQTLLDSDFIQESGGTSLFSRSIRPRPQLYGNWLAWLKPFIFPIIIIQVVIILFALFVYIPNYQRLTPSIRDFFWTDDIFTLYTVSFVISYILVFIHELGHFFASKAYGIESRINIFSTRVNQLVAETEHYFAFSIKKSHRINMYLMGILVDATIASLVLLALAFNVIPIEFIPIAKFVFLCQILGVLWQFNVFYKTDVYNTLCEWLGQENLYEDSLRYLQLKMRKYKPFRKMLPIFLKFLKTDDFSERFSDLTPTQKRNAKLFSVLFILGITQSFIIMAFISIPRDLILIQKAISEILVVGNPINLAKTVVVVAAISWTYLVLLVITIRKFAFK